MSDKKPKVIVICGPTASGKTALSINLAKKINGEIVSSDSMQIYKDMNIGTAKPDKEEMQNIEHYMMDFVSPGERYSVAKYKCEATSCIEKILSKGKVPIIVGGTGLYVNSLIYNITYNNIEVDEEYRNKLETIIENNGLEELYNKALKIDPEAMKIISKNDKKRILRVLEMYKQTGKTKTELEKESRLTPPKYDYKVFAIKIDREILYDRINKRVDIMINEGLIKEVEDILKKYKEFPTAMQGLGYKEVVEYLNNDLSKDEMIEKLKMETRRYAKRQITWFKKIENIKFLNIDKGIDNIIEEIEKEMQ